MGKIDTETRVTVAEGKYTFIIKTGDYRVNILRYNEPWLTIERGSNAIAALVYELFELKRK